MAQRREASAVQYWLSAMQDGRAGRQVQESSGEYLLATLEAMSESKRNDRNGRELQFI